MWSSHNLCIQVLASVITQRVIDRIQLFINKCLQRTVNVHWPDRISNHELWRTTAHEPVLSQLASAHSEKKIQQHRKTSITVGITEPLRKDAAKEHLEKPVKNKCGQCPSWLLAHVHGTNFHQRFVAFTLLILLNVNLRHFYTITLLIYIVRRPSCVSALTSP